MNASVRPLLVPGIALAAAGAVALGPALVAPPALTVTPPSLPAVQVADVQLAGIGQDIYYAITPWVQYGVELVEYGVGWIPWIGPPIVDQIDINYFDAIQPAVEATVNYLAAVVQNPFNFIAETGAYGNVLFGIGYNWVVQQFNFFFPWLPPLPPPLPLAAVQQVAVAPAAAAEVDAAVLSPEVIEPALPTAPVGPEPVVPAVDAEPVVTPVEEPLEATEGTEVSTVSDQAPASVSAAAESTSSSDEQAAAPVEAAATEADRPARAVRGEDRGSGKAVRAARGAE